MKRIVILTTIVLLATMAMMTSGQSAKQQPRKRHMPRKTLMIKRPASLKAGDKIAIISPASTPGDDNPDKAAATLRAWGFEPVIAPHVLAKCHMYAGTIQERCADLRWALQDSTIKAIVCTRGGYGSAMLLDPLTHDDFRRNPKWIVGYSDITALHSAMVCSGVMSLHANMGGALGSRGENDSINLMLRDVLMGSMPSYTVPAHPLNKMGSARGIVIGGNMAVFTNIGGSREWDFLDRDNIRDKNIILFFEDVSESMARVNSMLQALRLKGVLSQVKGIIVGRFTEYEPSNGYTDMYEMLAETLNQYDIPVCYDFPASHDEDWNYPMIEGCQATLTVAPEGVTLTFGK
ncbi:MAG: LD-carboxypeptidase [Muribaculaceae bacterium]|jgi:muramoyltetrapeptide carboxypeptidase|nr:LD-carboxypeptidase [Muribaculaceae bacterium]